MPTEQNDALAVAWWEKAAVGGGDIALYNLGVAYTNGLCGLPQNARCAKIFMMAAAAQGHVEANEALKVLQACAACGTPDASRTCQGCEFVTGISTVRYCNRECQKRHLKAHNKADSGVCLPPLREPRLVVIYRRRLGLRSNTNGRSE